MARNIFIVLFALFAQLVKSQDIDVKSQIGDVFKAAIQIEPKNTWVMSFSDGEITDYEFDGNYSHERVFYSHSVKDSTGKKDHRIIIICADPIRFSSSICEIVKKYDNSYDSVYYQNQIKKQETIIYWKDFYNNKSDRPIFINWKFKSHFRTITTVSRPIFSKDAKLAIIKIGELGVRKKGHIIYIFEKIDNKWTLKDSIKSIN
jgi:hypothetical protein